MKRWLLALALLLALLTLTGCRTRTTAPAGADRAGEAQAVLPDGPGADEERSGARPGAAARDTLPDGGGRTTEVPDAQRREYDEQASAQVAAGAEHELHQPGEGGGSLPSPEEQSGPAADRLDDAGGRTATQTVPAGEAERLGVAEEAEDADSVLVYYTVLLEDRLGQLFECHRLNLYWETAQAYRTIHKDEADHQLILTAGCYDVSARLLAENLTVDAGWVRRKDPGVIVKVVDRQVLGLGTSGREAALAAREELCRRPEWNAIDAVRAGRVVLLSEQLLTTPAMRTAAALIVARTAYPELMADVDPEEALRALYREETGAELEGMLFLAPDRQP